MSEKALNRTVLIIRVLLGGLFLFSGIGKLIESGDARYLVELMATEYYWLIEYSNTIILTTSLIECLLAVFLLWGKQLKLALAGSLVLITFFTGVLGYFWLQGQDVASCGCFGAFGFESGLDVTLIRNIILLAMIVSGLYLSGRRHETVVT